MADDRPTWTPGQDPEEVICRMAARHHGVVTRRELLDAGIPAHRIEWRVRRGRLRPLHQGVYLVGPLMLPRTREMAAVRACGRSAVLSHESAAILWRQTPRRPVPGRVHVAVRSGDHRRAGIRVHRVSGLRPDEVTRRDGIPVTTPARTLLDLAGILNLKELERALAETYALRLAAKSQILGLVNRHPKVAGIALLRSLLEGDPPGRLRSKAEDRFSWIVEEAKLPRPRTNVWVERLQVDALWPEEKVVVEIDGVRYHSADSAIERDRRRDARLIRAGYTVLRFTWKQLDEEAWQVVSTLSAALARGGLRAGHRSSGG